MAHHLPVVEVIYEVNQQDIPTFPKLHTSKMNIIPSLMQKQAKS
ncbi:MAG: hypothetical protein ACTS8H_01900 [Arsenophonus sp. NC-PE1-MAG3]